MQRFNNYELRIPDEQIENNKQQVKDGDVDRFDRSNYHFFGYEKSVYDYEKFDSFTEM